MQGKSKENALTLIGVLESARADAAKIVASDSSLNIIGIRVENTLKQLINGLKVQTGETPDASGTGTTAGIEKLTSIGGQKITAPTVDKEELVVKDDEKNALLAKVSMIEGSLSVQDNGEILKNFPTNHDILAIRALGKKAGIANYQTATVDEQFLQLIRSGLKKNESTKAADNKALIAQIEKASTAEEVEKLLGNNTDADVEAAALKRLGEVK